MFPITTAHGIIQRTACPITIRLRTTRVVIRALPLIGAYYIENAFSIHASGFNRIYRRYIFMALTTGGTAMISIWTAMPPIRATFGV
jgi:hypothetical protein